MKAWIRVLAGLASSYILSEALLNTAQVKQRVKALVFGAGLILGSTLLGMLAILLGIAAAFFALAELPRLVQPALATAGITIIVAVLGFLEGAHQFRR